MNPQATLEIWGDFALWTRPEGKVERITYPVPSPGGIRGVLSSIYSKPAEFYWQVCAIEVLRPIRYITFRRNEVKATMPRLAQAAPLKSCISVEDERTQRQSVVLQDVRYRITAELVPRPDFSAPASQLLSQFERRVRRGQCFLQPCMGTREFPAYFEWGSSGEPPVDVTLDMGYIVYDVFDLHRREVDKLAYPSVSLFHAELVRGVLNVPPYDSPEVRKPERGERPC